MTVAALSGWPGDLWPPLPKCCNEKGRVTTMSLFFTSHGYDESCALSVIDSYGPD